MGAGGVAAGAEDVAEAGGFSEFEQDETSVGGAVFVVATLYQGEVPFVAVESAVEQADAGELTALIAGVE